jgi:hypothetical protein
VEQQAAESARRNAGQGAAAKPGPLSQR